MTVLDKAKNRLRAMPKDYTFSEARQLLSHLDFKEYQKGKTSGSRVMFYRASDNKKVLLHKPHPGDEMSIANTRDLYEKLSELGDL
ncbi:MAG: type II toxin-antitoxin system HicA family toxin [Clostridiales bacterium]|nr:type II toxin-antitoxin system HicA family toxin [Clostridiales bacterium]